MTAEMAFVIRPELLDFEVHEDDPRRLLCRTRDDGQAVARVVRYKTVHDVILLAPDGSTVETRHASADRHEVWQIILDHVASMRGAA